ncbi:hypothetical protein KY361_04085 [Candidatus Woesearchaeota archaeon]|nr:hypothetical protein [Candidatus Woesearchaeota archaeon]
MEVSNKTIATLLLLAIVISLAGTLVSLNKIGRLGFSITGMAINTSTGTAQLTVGVLTELTNQIPTINWGTGYVAGNATDCTMDSEGTFSGCVGFTPQYEGFLLENTGNVNLSVNYTSDKNASEFINGTSPLFQLKVNENSVEQQNNETSALDSVASCGGAWTPGTYTDVTKSGSYLCGDSTTYPLSSEADKDAAVVDIKVRVPEDAPTGTKTAVLTFTGTSP